MSFNLSKKPLHNNINKKNHECLYRASGKSYTDQSNHQIPIMQRKLNCPCGGGCPRCVEKTHVQSKLKIGAPNDKYEQEADRTADQVMRMPDTTVVSSQFSGVWREDEHIQKMCSECKKEDEGEPIQTKSIAEQITPLIQRQETEEPDEEEDGESIQTKPLTKQITPLVQRQEGPEEELEEKVEGPEIMTKSDVSSQTDSSNLQSQLNVSKGAGSSLPVNVQTSMELAFGSDFSSVRVHTDSNAVQMNQGLKAKAFTYGNDVYFNKGKYNLDTNSGKHLLAHELTHVVQQDRKHLSRVPTVQRNDEKKNVASLPKIPLTTTSGPKTEDIPIEQRPINPPKFSLITIKLDIFLMAGSKLNPIEEVEVASRIWLQCSIEFEPIFHDTYNENETRKLIGTDQGEDKKPVNELRLHFSPDGTNEMENLRSEVSKKGKGELAAIFVPNVSMFPSAADPKYNIVYIGTKKNWTGFSLAHELGHRLIDSTATHGAFQSPLMHPDKNPGNEIVDIECRAARGDPKARFEIIKRQQKLR